MPVHIAAQTLIAFERSVAADQGNAYRMWLARVVPHIGDAYRQDHDLFRSHMGASGIGDECARKVWYGFRWATSKKFSGRMIRLFNRGHMEEARFIALMLSIGCNVIQQDAEGKQFKISEYGGHYGGSGDGMVEGLPGLEGHRALTEFKTHSSKSFKALAGDNWDAYMAALLNPQLPAVPFKGEGVRGAKFEHYVQMQQYMSKMGLAVGVYFAVDKDTDHIYAEILPLDRECADKFSDRAIKIIPMHEPPKRINESAGWFGCKFCDHRPVCHMGAAPQRNCRTCEWSVPREDGKWYCENPVVTNGEQWMVPLDKAEQLKGCSHWAKNSAAFK